MRLVENPSSTGARPAEAPEGCSIEEYVRHSRAAQGLPPTIEDEQALESFAAMVADALTRAGEGARKP